MSQYEVDVLMSIAMIVLATSAALYLWGIGAAVLIFVAVIIALRIANN